MSFTISAVYCDEYNDKKFEKELEFLDTYFPAKCLKKNFLTVQATAYLLGATHT